MYRTQKFLLQPTVAQVRLFRQAAGASRFVWNWGVRLTERYFRMFRKHLQLDRLLVQWQKAVTRRFQWAEETAKHMQVRRLEQLDWAYRQAFGRLAKKQDPCWPRLKRKRDTKPSFFAGRGKLAFRFYDGRLVRKPHKPCSVFVPKAGKVRTTRRPRWSGPDVKTVQGSIKLVGRKWWLFVMYDIPTPPPVTEPRPTCGIDLGHKTFATISSDGAIVEEVTPPRPKTKTKFKLRRASRTLSRREFGGQRHERARLRYARCCEQATNVRSNFLHQLTSRLVRDYGTVVIEDLNLRALFRGLTSRTIGDLGFGEFRRQLSYKIDNYGTTLLLADRHYPSTKMCSACGVVRDKVTLSERVFECYACGHRENRDHNAARNLETLAAGGGKVTRVEIGSQAGPSESRRCRSVKRERAAQDATAQRPLEEIGTAETARP